MANQDEAGKLFIGGIHRSTTQESLKNYFEKFGKIKECKLMIDKLTGNSRGFGFVTYVDPLSVNEVLLKKPHTLDNKMIDAKPCANKSSLPAKKPANNFPKTHKIFVGGVSMEATEDDVRIYFTRYGVVVEVNLVSDRQDPSRPHKGFGFVTFEDESSVDQALAKHYHTIKNKRCEAKSAEQKKDQNNGMSTLNLQPQMLGLVTGGQSQQPQQQQQQQAGANQWMNGGMMNYGYGYAGQYNAAAAATTATGAATPYTNAAYAGYGYSAAAQQYQQQQQAMSQMMPGANMAGTVPNPAAAGGMPPVAGAPGAMAANPAAMAGMQQQYGGMQQPAHGQQPAPATSIPQANMGYQQPPQQQQQAAAGGYGPGPIRQGGNLQGNGVQQQPMGGAHRGAGGHHGGQGYHPYRR